MVTLLDSQVGVDGGISGGACQILALSVGDVLAVSLDVSLGQAEVQDEYFVGSFVQPNAEIVGLDIPVDEVPVVDILDPGDHLVDEHEDSLQ